MKIRDIKRRKVALLLSTELVQFRFDRELLESLANRYIEVMLALDFSPIEQRVISHTMNLQQIPKNFMGTGRLFKVEPEFQMVEGR